MREAEFNDLSEEDKELLKAARNFLKLKRSHHPYSGFSVSAAVRSIDGKIIRGVNVENAAYGSSMCAERIAIWRAFSQGHKKSCKAVAIVTETENGPTAEPSNPCGDCRQVMKEAADLSGVNEHFKVITAATNLEKVELYTLGELLPHAFGASDLDIEIKNPNSGIQIEALTMPTSFPLGD